MMWGYNPGWGGWLMMSFGMVFSIADCPGVGADPLVQWAGCPSSRTNTDDATTWPLGLRDSEASLCPRRD